jgi:hypothetical protein
MFDKTKGPSMPDIIISPADSARLTDLATAAMRRMPEIADQLLSEIERAKVSAAASVLSKVARMGSTVTFRLDDGQSRPRSVPAGRLPRPVEWEMTRFGKDGAPGSGARQRPSQGLNSLRSEFPCGPGSSGAVPSSSWNHDRPTLRRCQIARPKAATTASDNRLPLPAHDKGLVTSVA